jgi:ankyrin repeat protein
VEDFLAIGKDVNMADEQQRSPLHYAAAYDHAEVAQALLDAGAKLEAVDSKSNTPLHSAAGYGRGELVVLLLEKGANKGAKNETGKTPAELATMDPRNPVGQDEGLMMALTP